MSFMIKDRHPVARFVIFYQLDTHGEPVFFQSQQRSVGKDTGNPVSTDSSLSSWKAFFQKTGQDFPELLPKIYSRTSVIWV